jgi:hypothetical protein
MAASRAVDAVLVVSASAVRWLTLRACSGANAAASRGRPAEASCTAAINLAAADGYCFVEGADPGVGMISGYFPDFALSLTLLANVDIAMWKRFPALAAVCRDQGQR